MNHLERLIAIIDFLGNDISQDQAEQLMSDARENLSIAEMEILKAEATGALYTLLSMYDGEMGGLSRY